MKPTLLAAAAALVALSSLGAYARYARVFDAPLIQQTPRTSCRVVFFSKTGVGGEYWLDYASPEWKAEYDQKFDDETLGKRVRLGKDAWSTFECTCPVTIGGKDVKPGYYYLALERAKKGAWSLVLLDADDLRKKRTDAFASSSTTGGLAVPLEEGQAGNSAQLKISFEAGKADLEQVLKIEWGPHTLTSEVRAKV